VGGEQSSKELSEQRINIYSEHHHMSPRQHIYSMYIVCIPVFKKLELEREKLGEINCTEPDTNKDFVYINIYILNAFFEFFRIQNAE